MSCCGLCMGGWVGGGEEKEVGGWVGGEKRWVSGWVGGWVAYLFVLEDLIDAVHPDVIAEGVDAVVGGWVGGRVGGWVDWLGS